MSERPRIEPRGGTHAGTFAALLRDPQLWVPVFVLALGLLVLLWIA